MRSLLYISFSVLFSDLVSARHVHRPLRHKHQHQHLHHRAATSTVTLPSSISSSSPGQDLIQDVTQIEQGLNDLPQDILDWIQAVEREFDQAKSLLASLLAPLTSAPSIPEPTAGGIPTEEATASAPAEASFAYPTYGSFVSPATYLPPAVPTSFLTLTSSPTAATTARPSLCPLGGAGPLVPCSELYPSSLASTTAPPLVTRTIRTTTYNYITHTVIPVNNVTAAASESAAATSVSESFGSGESGSGASGFGGSNSGDSSSDTTVTVGSSSGGEGSLDGESNPLVSNNQTIGTDDTLPSTVFTVSLVPAITPIFNTTYTEAARTGTGPSISPTFSNIQDIGSSNPLDTMAPTTTTTTTSIPSLPTPAFPTHTFDARASNNVAVYYGQTQNTTVDSLYALCNDSNVDIVLLSFVTAFFTPSGMPSASFGPGCHSSTPAQQLHAPGLQDCTALAPAIRSCQASQKKVLVSLGGYYANVSLPSPSAALQAASNLWNLFGAGTALDSSLRPFGSDVILDGFDLDNESADPDFYTTFAAALRDHFATDASRREYYISAAPQCPRPDAGLTLETLALVDWVWVQFYNNPQCDLDGDGFRDSFAAWSSDLAGLASAADPTGPRLFVGAPANAQGGSGYVEGAGLGSRISLARELGTENLGGVMLWDGTEALDNVNRYGDDYLVYAKASLE